MRRSASSPASSTRCGSGTARAARPRSRPPRTPRSRPRQAGLLGVWNLNEGTGTSLADSSGNGVTGAAVASPTWVAGFDPPRRLRLRATTPSPSTAPASTRRSGPRASSARRSFTVELWFKRTARGADARARAPAASPRYPADHEGSSRGRDAAGRRQLLLRHRRRPGKLVADFEEAQVAQGGTTPGLNHPITGTAVIAADSTWHHAAATYDGTTWNLYLDGALDGTLAWAGPANAADQRQDRDRHLAEHRRHRCAARLLRRRHRRGADLEQRAQPGPDPGRQEHRDHDRRRPACSAPGTSTRAPAPASPTAPATPSPAPRSPAPPG